LLLNTGGAIKKAGWFFDDGKPFLVHNVDIFSNINLTELYQSHVQSDMLASLVVSPRETSRYLLFNQDLYMEGWINYMTGEIRPESLHNIQPFQKLAFSGIQILSPEVLTLMEQFPDQFPIMSFYLSNTDKKIKGYVPDKFQMLDVGKIDILDRAEEFLETIQK
jgi:NDP-sugar pyrophosphorylase family protein